MTTAFFRTAIIALSLALPAAAFAEAKPVEQLKTFLAKTRSLTADFKQVLINEAGNPAQTTYGVFYLQRPGKFRWDYQKPFQQQIISTDGKVWFYDTDLEQVTVKKLGDSVGSTPALLLSGDIVLEDNYTMEQQGVDGDLQWIKLLPKSQDSSFKYLTIGLEKGDLSGMELSDNFGQLTRIYFSNIKHNPTINPTLFKFEAPKGVDVFSE
ncbi:outer membrane lipoprotein chaperone LolA [Methylovulum psychrotolerans]|jgi:outer membrane lipoprotein carrier protein|uniref:Outer-membrane lipoprotein carrier protein n=1 Tax=Methylovulum psychrotolerans TaxID=1704499 RepID=A0A1Z4BUW8_9GAMM|nr:outer membrane lipoprotein chaperone LolA [Methylovulum psychrotolerans]ASF45043.1 outer membrane lipoprotein carrier protein LolA [Methylovulum psychrotolerans]MBT9096912.1 outer membrane lipoprotein chaperone LolA [Methylovulum psychrotolerans]POZ51101.1 outer membrane lipoprotein carrier protein LolA [Methylovulum psychrotolerans]